MLSLNSSKVYNRTTMSNKASFQISIPKRASCCAQGQEPLSSGMDYYSILKEGPEEGSYLRYDYCPACWPAVQKQQDKEIRSSWKAHIPSKKELSDLPKQRDARALHLLKEIIARQDSQAEAEAFVLALYLARRRKIVLRQEVALEKGKRASLYEVLETEEMLCIPKLSLSELQIDSVQQELAKKFQH